MTGKPHTTTVADQRARLESAALSVSTAQAHLEKMDLPAFRREVREAIEALRAASTMYLEGED
jgi:hypothetical protein